MRICIVCKEVKEPEDPGIRYDFCQKCLATDIETLNKRRAEFEARNEEAPQNPAKESREA
jgi:hypothetical protein